MQTIVELIDPINPDHSVIKRAAVLIQNGNLVAFPTETVYGLGADALNATAVARIFECKGRPVNNPVIAHVSSIDQARTLVAEWTLLAQKVADAFWPGPLTMVLPKSRLVPDIVTAGASTVAIRFPAHPVARMLITTAGTPIAAPSANLSNQISPTIAAHVLKGLDGKIPMILDSQERLASGLESTVIKLSSDTYTILRPGPINSMELAAALGVVSRRNAEKAGTISSETQLFESPGMQKKHYAPKANLTLFEDNPPSAAFSSGTFAPKKTALVIRSGYSIPPDLKAMPFQVVRMPESPGEYAADLYVRMHMLDDSGIEDIFWQLPPNESEWEAIRDRLTHAAA